MSLQNRLAALPRRRWRAPSAVSLGAGGVVVLFVLAAAVGPELVGADLVATSARDRLLPPGSTTSDGSFALLGTDQVGRDMVALLLVGARISIIVGAAALLLAGSIGLLLGMVSGFRGGALDNVVMRIADIQLAFPNILLAILIAAVLGPSLANVILTLSITSWVVFARVARARTMSIIREGHVEASRALGAGPRYLLFRNVLPNVIPAMSIVATVEAGLIILTEASLSFLGLGTSSSAPSWGLLIAEGRNYITQAWWISTLPGIALAVLIVCLGLLGDQFRDRQDPHSASKGGTR